MIGPRMPHAVAGATDERGDRGAVGTTSGRVPVGIVGCGVIGSLVARAVVEELSSVACLAALHDRRRERAEALAGRVAAGPVAATLDEVVHRSRLVIEAASAAGAPGIVCRALRTGCHVLAMSVGGLVGHEAELRASARHGGRLHLPSGALAGLDAVRAALVGSLSRVELITRKPPAAFLGAPGVASAGVDLGHVVGEQVLYDGPVGEAVRRFPANVNVAAALVLQGVDAARLRVRIIADPQAVRNSHELVVEGEFGRLVTRTENVPSTANPATSQLAAWSAVAAVREIVESLSGQPVPQEGRHVSGGRRPVAGRAPALARVP